MRAMGDAHAGAVVALAGRLDGRRTGEVRGALRDHLEQHPDQDVVIDLAEVPSVDAASLRVLAATAVRLQQDGRHTVLRGCSPAVRRMLAFTGCRRVFVLER